MDPNRDWRAPIAAGAYLTMSVIASVIVTFVLGYFLFLRPLDHQASLRQHDTNTIARALCVSRIRSLETYNDKHTALATRKASLKAANAYESILSGLSPHPPTKCLGVDPNP